ncbi:MAG: phosphoglycerate mutase (2,3-diphosphoglycerate-independent) [Candidatus Liptonbacteria bacterium RIFCSPLOWO2_01_FULL_52_25]|uniref:2,3-bisphosphoglycerate-independent phosphoglycerate mutase n=1 Tax=Candidatus Liptonbacteria bacterium RIFCSPLOWO2_01_FULL_52_25 TaxID=1798650 RepID=A0A1G2CEN7_9BACT|nr:MAG: phosphoglycerate mutase (2,3-diphosphoglycerate-independent) [Candidatus Liptonbacteria bacterium RIFCSPLOWO2_01_FULL_52_25]
MAVKRTVILIVLDGWGIGRQDESNPIHVVQPKTFKWLEDNFPVTSLQASGIAVGLPWGEVGNSEVGHLTLGAGKVLYQYFPKITMAIKDGTFFENKALKDAFAHARKNNSCVNFAGLLSKGNVHASLEHLQALLKMAEVEKISNIKLHLFADGKDVAPRTVEKFLEAIPREKIATLTGRYYAMDRNGSWRLTESAYQNLTSQMGMLVADPHEVIESTYKKGFTEEYLPPLRLMEDPGLKDGDALFFFNYREDSIRQLAESFIIPGFNQFTTKPIHDLYVATMTHYRDDFDVPIAFPADKVEKPLGQILSETGMAQLRLAETYKYAHVTYFFNALKEPPYTGEYRTLVPSLPSIHAEEHPEMMAKAVTDRLLDAAQSLAFDFILVNYANGDTISHTANYDASLQAVRVIDEELARLFTVAVNPNTVVIVTSDHGNMEELLNPATGLPESQHDANPVPLYLVAPEFQGRKFSNWRNLGAETLGSLADVAPTVLQLLGIPQSPEMTGHSLLDSLV